MKIGEYRIYSEPNWEYELVESILEKDGKREEDTLKTRKFVMSEKEIEEFLFNIKEFKQKVLAQVLPLLDEYQDIKPYFSKSLAEEDNRARHILSSLASRKVLAKEHTTEEIDKIVLDVLENWAKSINESEQNDKHFEGLQDIISFLKNVEEEDSVKFRLIMFFTERHAIFPRLQEFVIKGIQILQEHFHIIQEDFEKAVITLQDKRNMEDYFDRLEVIKLGAVNGIAVQPCIIAYNQLSIDWVLEENRDIIADTGIYMLLPDALESDYFRNDAELTGALKALGDATRIKIVHMLSGKKMYIQEMAEILELTPATVSHHMNVLLQERLVSITVDSTNAKKVFYEINTSRTKALGDAVKLLGATDTLD